MLRIAGEGDGRRRSVGRSSGLPGGASAARVGGGGGGRRRGASAVWGRMGMDPRLWPHTLAAKQFSRTGERVVTYVFYATNVADPL